MLGKAIALASKAFEGYKDKGGKPYIMHCLRVMFSVQHLGEEVMTIAVLHDVIEDTKYTFKDLKELGFNEEVIKVLRLLTHDKEKVSYDDYIKKLANNTKARKIKMADLMDNSNFTRLKGVSKRDFDRMEKYQRSYLYLEKV